MDILSEKRYYGTAVFPGIAFGKAYLLAPIENVSKRFCENKFFSPVQEKNRFLQARKVFCQQAERQARWADKRAQTLAQIFSAQQALACDAGTETRIFSLLDAGFCAEAAVDRVCTQLQDKISNWSTDIEDVRMGLLAALAGTDTYEFLESLPVGTILITADISPAMVSHLRSKHIAAILCQKGGTSSHSAILIRALGIPCIMQLSEILEIPDKTEILCDAAAGKVIAAPDSITAARYLALEKQHRLQDKLTASYRTKETRTADGIPGQVFCNITSAKETEEGILQGAQGVGLFRTEYLWTAGAPDEETQVLQYQKAASYLQKKQPLCIRTIDPGRDKTPWMATNQRGIQYSLAHTEQCKTQLRAVLRAAIFGQLHLLLPMVTDPVQLQQVRELLEICRNELDLRGLARAASVPVGAMIETPAAVFIADQLAAQADFFSIGTGDLTQYVMASPRDAAESNTLYTALPVLRAIRHAARAAANAGIPCHICGEAAADPCMIPLLLSFGITSFSVSPPMIPAVRQEISLWTAEEAHTLEALVLREENVAAFEEISQIRENKLKQRIFCK